MVTMGARPSRSGRSRACACLLAARVRGGCRGRRIRIDTTREWVRIDNHDARSADIRVASKSLVHAPAPMSEQPALSKRSEEHTSELQSLMRISYAVFCFKKKNNTLLCSFIHNTLLSSLSHY